jgi:hypothetical protein
VWLNTDRNKTSGHQIPGWAGGAEYNVSVDARGLPRLFSGAECRTLTDGARDGRGGDDMLNGGPGRMAGGGRVA